MEWSLGGSLSELYPMTPPTNQMAATAEIRLTLDPMEIHFQIFLSGTTCLIGTKLWLNYPQVVIFQNCIQ